MQNTELKPTLRKNDMVQVIAGREKGKTGKVLSVDVSSHRVVVEKMNMVKRHQKPTQANRSGGIIEKESSIHYSNVLLLCGKCNKGVRVGHKVVDKKKVRVCKRCESVLETA